ncbi:hypothetical protein SKAU_G00067860 [Synaphobranchus kaupii]|uniref:Uncharacterized protein n=1 Tax=Synaphobranchus kaupii TaxID=118154 RepID=A0A9Q1G734_SYNKA|nr:hypothetical protein SKAU_G00067860 [Synaphobranchus kaupii]
MKSRQTYDKIFEKIWAASAHSNLRDPVRLIFSPFEGRLRDPTPENIQLAKEGKLKVSLPWLNVKKRVSDSNGHPLTGSAEHYALYDKFHEDNTKDDRDALCKLGLVPQVAGQVNSQVAEQLFAQMKKNNYFLTQQLPSTHLFLMRNIIEHYNNHKNQKRINDIKKTFGTKAAMNSHHQAVLGMSIPVELETPMDIDMEYSPVQPWEKTQNPIQEQLLNYVLDKKRPAEEIIVKEGQTCLTRDEFWSLGLNRYMDATIGNACLKLIGELALKHGKDIYIADMYAVPTWKDQSIDPLASFPDDMDMKDAIVFPAWTKNHFVLCAHCTAHRS